MTTWKVFGSRRLILRCDPDICLEGLIKITKHLNQDILSPGPSFEPGTSRIRNRSDNHSTTMFGYSEWRREASSYIHPASHKSFILLCGYKLMGQSVYWILGLYLHHTFRYAYMFSTVGSLLQSASKCTS